MLRFRLFSLLFPIITTLHIRTHSLSSWLNLLSYLFHKMKTLRLFVLLHFISRCLIVTHQMLKQREDEHREAVDNSADWRAIDQAALRGGLKVKPTSERPRLPQTCCHTTDTEIKPLDNNTKPRHFLLVFLYQSLVLGGVSVSLSSAD